MNVKFFSPSEANRYLPSIQKTVAQILAHGQQARALLSASSSGENRHHLLDLEDRIKSLSVQLEEQGCYFKDWNFEIGLVDFPAIINGCEALLCWRSDEPRVEWFHGWDDGYAGRRPITRDLIFS